MGFREKGKLIKRSSRVLSVFFICFSLAFAGLNHSSRNIYYVHAEEDPDTVYTGSNEEAANASENDPENTEGQDISSDEVLSGENEASGEETGGDIPGGETGEDDLSGSETGKEDTEENGAGKEDVPVDESGKEGIPDEEAGKEDAEENGTGKEDIAGEETGKEDAEENGAGKEDVPGDESDKEGISGEEAGKEETEENETGKEDITGDEKEKDSQSGETDETGDDNEDEEPEPASSKKKPKPVLLKTSITLYAGWESYEIFIDKLDEEAKVTYTSSKTAIATVDEEGVVTPIKKGTTRITAVVTDSDGRKTKLKLTVKVKKPYTEVTEMTDALTSRGSFRFRLKRHGHADEVKWTLTGSQFATIEAVSDTDCLISGIAPGDVILVAECGGFAESFDIHVYEGSGEAYRITPSKEPYKGYYMSRSEYNDYTKDYYTARSYLERLASAGGGLLVFTAGTYHFTNTLCIPSNTTILLEDGATLVKSDQTGTAWLSATQSLFHTVAYNHTNTKFTKYNGEHDIAIIGEGSATIDLNYLKSIAITAAHCQRLTIKGIAFKNLNSAHFIELDASKDVEITGNTFSNCVPSPTQRKEAINLDTPDEVTHGFIQGWTSYDKTPNANVTICDNVFENLETAIGTHKYSEGKYHKNIVIERNTFVDVTSYVVRMMNWKNSKVSDNYFLIHDRTDEEKAVNAIILNGAVNPTVTGNYFYNFTTAISCAHWKNSGEAKIYAETYNKLSKTNLKAMKKNEVVSCTNNYFEVYTVYGDKTDKYLEKYKFSKP